MLRRPRRNRYSKAIRDLAQETYLQVTDFIAPLFLIEGNGQPEPVSSMPGVYRLPIDKLVDECIELFETGIRAVLLFPCPKTKYKNPAGSYALDANNFLFSTISRIKSTVPELTVMTDVALDPYTTHGHDGVLDGGGDVDNDRTVEILSKMSILHAQAGADFVAPSDMMDGRVQAIRESLDAKEFHKVGIMAYSAKYASAFYGPFREAVGSGKKSSPKSASDSETVYLDKKTYQLHPANSREALLEAELDEKEGADILMIKPAGPYLDILSQIKEITSLPLAAYQVSGEYAQIHAAAKLGWLDLHPVRDESLLAIKRAGANMIISYFAKEMAQALR
ncbi:MAG: porphobilinogen synthase [Verrucomicrobiota bacterium]